jgi:LacI family transcriptional regulator
VAEAETRARPTYRDVARLAGTSQATVSLVLNGRDSKLGISAATRQAVLDAARELGYTPDLGARRLRDARAGAAAPELTLAILRPAGTPVGLSGRVIEAAAGGLAEQAPTAQLVVEEYQPGHLDEHPGLRVAARFHGAILTSLTPADEAFLEAHDLPVPVVAFQRQLTRHACVDVDNVAGGLAVTRHLLRRGRRRIAAVGWASVPSRAVERRLEGLRMALAEAGLAGTERVEWVPELSEAGGAAGGAALLAAARPDAILALSDVIALGVLSAVHRTGRRVPEDVAVAGYDDLPFAPYLEPPLTTVRLPYEAMGRAAVSWLIGAVRGRAASRLAERYQPELVIRDST